MNISHRVPFDDLAKRMPGAILAFVPQSPLDQLMYNEYVRYFGAKARAGVATLDANDSLYLVPPVGEASGLLSALEAAGAPAPLPRNCILGVITAKPTATGAPAVAAAPVPAAPPPAPAAATPAAPAAPAVPADAPAPKVAEKAAEDETKATAGEKGEAAPAKPPPADDGEEGGEMSGEALMNLFSNPDLIKSLQGMEEPGDE